VPWKAAPTGIGSTFGLRARVGGGFETLTFKGKPFVFDEHALNNRIYFLSHDGPYIVNGGGGGEYIDLKLSR
jgi:hypothetical protein